LQLSRGLVGGLQLQLSMWLQVFGSFQGLDASDRGIYLALSYSSCASGLHIEEILYNISAEQILVYGSV
jgi:hypothetical protein